MSNVLTGQLSTAHTAGISPSALAVLSCKGLVKRFQSLNGSSTNGQTDGTAILQGVDLTVRQGESIAIVGASGAGKSTLLHVLGGLDQADAGEVHWAGQNIAQWSVAELGAQRNQNLGFVYQFHHLLPELTALDNVALALRIGGVHKAQAQAQAKGVLDQLDLAARMAHRPGELSGGERQRVAIARAMVTKPKAILADEPTGNLDQATANTVFETLLGQCQARGMALVMVTHSTDLAARCQRALRLSQGRLVELE